MGNNNYNEFERIIRDKISDYSYNYDQSEWSSFEKKLKKSTKNPFTSGKNLLYFLAVAMLGTIVYFTANHFILNEKSTDKFVTNANSNTTNNNNNSTNLNIDNNNKDNSTSSTVNSNNTETNNNNNNKDITNDTKSNNNIVNKNNQESNNSSTTQNNIGTNKTKVNYSFDELIFSDIVEGCVPLKVQFTPLIISDTISYTWSFGDKKTSTKQAPSHVYTKAGNYDVTLTCKFKKSQQIKKITYSQTINVKATPNAEFVYSKDEETDIYSFTDESANATAWQWNFGDNNYSKEKNAKHEYKKNGSYDVKLIIMNSSGCSDTARKYIDVKLKDIFSIPGAFSPNYDGLNDYFGPSGDNLTNDGYTMTIYNKSGIKLFETKELETKWDGKNSKTNQIVEPGVYIWKIKIKDKYGNPQERTDFVTIVP